LKLKKAVEISAKTDSGTKYRNGQENRHYFSFPLLKGLNLDPICRIKVEVKIQPESDISKLADIEILFCNEFVMRTKNTNTVHFSSFLFIKNNFSRGETLFNKFLPVELAGAHSPAISPWYYSHHFFLGTTTLGSFQTSIVGIIGRSICAPISLPFSKSLLVSGITMLTRAFLRGSLFLPFPFAFRISASFP
jgi:hypothetical protein